ncbi:hypothetical protein ABE237_29240 [Brevibacillus formosus]|uniref:hypothetical protein n=1 Tax=Brevibacillus formosus TaxID=54913 RepID=UPI0018CF12E8|nr:hypothetical protein [Brevibacillus formosus]MBG9942318.1 hypothetical protein [Brevibacillus formosus]
MLTKDELIHWINNMFQERLLTKEEQEDEIKKFREGVAPLQPSFIINQDSLISKLKHSFHEFYAKTRVMESYVIVGNPGDGKSHILNTIHSYLKSINNNIVINERTQGFGTKFDMVSLILNKVNSPVTIQALTKKIKDITQEYTSQDQYIQIDHISSSLQVSFALATLLWKITYSSSDLEKIKAMNILTSRDSSPNTLHSLEIENFDKTQDVLDFFYVIMAILREKNIFIIILIEELEHIFKWDPIPKLKFYEQLKEFIDNSQKLGNLFILMFSTYVLNDEYSENQYTQDIYLQDRALYTRLQPKVIKIKRISSKEEVSILVEKLVERYMKVYKLSSFDFNKLMEEINASIKGDNKTFRSYIQRTAYLLDQLKETSEKKTQENEFTNLQELEKTNIDKDEKIEYRKTEYVNKILNEITQSSSLAIKKKILLSIYKLLENSNYKDIVLEVKKGFLYGIPKNKRNHRLFYFDYAPINKVQEKYNSLVNLPDLADELNCDKNNLYYIYLKERVTDNTEQKLQNYNPSINLVALRLEDVVELMLLTEEELEDIEKMEISRDLSPIFKLEIGESNG